MQIRKINREKGYCWIISQSTEKQIEARAGYRQQEQENALKPSDCFDWLWGHFARAFLQQIAK